MRHKYELNRIDQADTACSSLTHDSSNSFKNTAKRLISVLPNQLTNTNQHENNDYLYEDDNTPFLFKVTAKQSPHGRTNQEKNKNDHDLKYNHTISYEMSRERQMLATNSQKNNNNNNYNYNQHSDDELTQLEIIDESLMSSSPGPSYITKSHITDHNNNNTGILYKSVYFDT